MSDRPENHLRKFGPLLAAGLCMWGASSVADDLPDSVRERALQELRVLDRAAPRSVPRTKQLEPTAKPDVKRSAVSAASTIEQPAAVQASPAPKAMLPAAVPSQVGPFGAEPVPGKQLSDKPTSRGVEAAAAGPTVQARHTQDDDFTPTITPARKQIVRPVIRQQSAPWNPWEEVSIPATTADGQDNSLEVSMAEPSNSAASPAARPDAFETTTTEEWAPNVKTQLSPEAATALSTSVKEVDPQAGEAEVNPFAVDADAEQNRSANAVPPTASLAAESNTKPKSVEKAPENEPSPPRAKVTNNPVRKVTKGRAKEQLGTDAPISVLDFLAQNASAELSQRVAATPPSTDAQSAPLSGAGATANANSSITANGSTQASNEVLKSIEDLESRLRTPPSEQIADQNSSLAEQRKLDARADQDGFMGFCPVMLRDQKTLVDAQTAFESNYGGTTVRFASLEAKLIFDGDPTRYMPANAGQDIVLGAGQITVPGSLRHATYYQNRLYLFRSEQTCRLFVSDPARYVTDTAQ